MEPEIKTAIKELAQKSQAKDTKSHEAMQFSQAALNLAHAAQVIQQVEKST